MSGTAVAATADGKLHSAIPRQPHHISDIGGICWPDNDGWAAVKFTVENGAGFVIRGVVRRDNLSLNGAAELRKRKPLGNHSVLIFSWHFDVSSISNSAYGMN